MTTYRKVTYQDRCAWKFCNTLMDRDRMKRIKGRRGYFCPTCYEFVKKTPKKS